MKREKIICMIGPIELDYAHTWKLIRGLETIKVGYHTYPMNQKISWTTFRGAMGYLKKNKNDVLAIWVTNFSQQVFPFIWLARFFVWPIKSPPIVYDSVISIYDTRVHDRGWVKKYSIRALYYFFLDWFACKTASVVVVDSLQHKNFFVKTFRVNRKKIIIVYPGVNRDRFSVQKTKQRGEEFVVSYHGKLIPGMGGVEHIIDAARTLKNDNIVFRIFGKGSLLDDFELIVQNEKLKNVFLEGWIKENDLPARLLDSDVILGMFGTTDKAKRAIPLKVFEGFAMKKPVIAGDTPAAREILKDNYHCVLAKIGSSSDLVEKIKLLQDDVRLCENIAKNGYELYNGLLSHKAVGEKILEILKIAKEKI